MINSGKQTVVYPEQHGSANSQRDLLNSPEFRLYGNLGPLAATGLAFLGRYVDSQRKEAGCLRVRLAPFPVEEAWYFSVVDVGFPLNRAPLQRVVLYPRKMTAAMSKDSSS